MAGAVAIPRSTCAMRGAEGRKPRKATFDDCGVGLKETADAADAAFVHAPARRHRPSCVQYAPNTQADRTRPRSTFTTTPALNAASGRPPIPARSRTRVVRPILRKPNANAHVRKFLIGVTRSDVAAWLKAAWPTLCATKVMNSEASAKPRTNFGNRRQISPPLAPFLIPVDSHRVVATIESTAAQMPIQMSRPTTFISVKAATVWSAAPASAPGTLETISPKA